MKRILISLFALLTCIALFTSCVKPAETTPNSEPEVIVEPTPPPYLPNFFTGEERDSSYDANRRPVAIMVNNIAACRPQRGLSQADILVESKVEGGITRFMAIYQDYTKVTGDIGPVRSGRDQFLRLIMPYDALYMHIGRSGITQTYIDSFNYNDKDVDGYNKAFAEYDQARINRGYSSEHTAFTTAEKLTNVYEKYDYSTTKENVGTWIEFANYADGGVYEFDGESAISVGITHSSSYRTYFDYNETTGTYYMSQYNSRKKIVEDTVDEGNGVQLNFKNLLVLFADIKPYPYPGGNLDKNGNDKGDPDYQNVDMDFGCVGYYFSNGKVIEVRWYKGGATDALRITDMDENPLPLNCGKTYISFVDLDEYYNFSYTGNEEEVITEPIVDDNASSEVEAGD